MAGCWSGRIDHVNCANDSRWSGETIGPSDLALLLAVPEGIFDFPINPAQAAAFLSDPLHEIVVALNGDGVILGMASARIMLHPDKPPAGFINELGVHEAHRRRGIARALCAELFAILRAHGCIGLWLATEHDNEPARGLYAKLDGRETGDIVVYDWDGAMDVVPD